MSFWRKLLGIQENYLIYILLGIQENKWNALIRKTKVKYFQNISKDTTATSKTFLKAIKSFIIKDSIIKTEVDEDVMVKDTNLKNLEYSSGKPQNFL